MSSNKFVNETVLKPLDQLICQLRITEWSRSMVQGVKWSLRWALPQILDPHDLWENKIIGALSLNLKVLFNRTKVLVNNTVWELHLLTPELSHKALHYKDELIPNNMWHIFYQFLHITGSCLNHKDWILMVKFLAPLEMSVRFLKSKYSLPISHLRNSLHHWILNVIYFIFIECLLENKFSAF